MVFGDNLHANAIFSKTKISKIIQFGGFYSRISEPLMKISLPLIKHIIKPLARRVFMPSGLTTAVSLKDKAISKETHG